MIASSDYRGSPPSEDTARPKPYQGRRACRGNEAERGIIRAPPLFHFHSAPIGKKIELITQNNMVCFEVDIDHEPKNSEIPCNWSSKYSSVIGYGKARFITDSAQKKDALNIIIDHYSPETSYNFPEKNLHEVTIIKIEITRMTGKKSRLKKVSRHLQAIILLLLFFKKFQAISKVLCYSNA